MVRLVFDCNYLCYRALYSRGGLQTEGEATSVIFGFLIDVSILMDRFKTNRTAFTWDFGRGHRCALDPGYKASRAKKREEETEEERTIRDDFNRQVGKLRDKILKNLGFSNVFKEEGFEADDIIGSIVKNNVDEDIVIVSADEDLWQLIRGNVQCYNPRSQKLYGVKEFRDEWGLEPAMWAHIKAWAGCGSDDIVGLHGVGEATAAKFYRGELKKGSKTLEKFMSTEGLSTHNKNYRLTKLPFEGCPDILLKEDNGPIKERWHALADHFQMPTLRGYFPGEPKGVKERKGFGL